MTGKGEQQVSLERILAEIRREKGIDKLVIIDALKLALVNCCPEKIWPQG